MTTRPKLQKLVLVGCMMTEGKLSYALHALPALRHLELKSLYSGPLSTVSFPGEMLSGLQMLTYLELADGLLYESAVMQNLHYLTDLQHLCLISGGTDDDKTMWHVTAADLSTLQHLTSLELQRYPNYRPDKEPGPDNDHGILFNKLKPCRLCLDGVDMTELAPVSELLSRVPELLRLKHLSLQGSLRCRAHTAAPFAALTANSGLTHLDQRGCDFPPEAWLCMLPAGRLLPHLQCLLVKAAPPNANFEDDDIDIPLDYSTKHDKTTEHMTFDDVTRLVTCCPGLQQLWVSNLITSAEALALLQDHLPHLQDLDAHAADEEAVAVLALMAGLKNLVLSAPHAVAEVARLQLTGLRQLDVRRCDD
jgi:hypothetical protein